MLLRIFSVTMRRFGSALLAKRTEGGARIVGESDGLAARRSDHSFGLRRAASHHGRRTCGRSPGILNSQRPPERQQEIAARAGAPALTSANRANQGSRGKKTRAISPKRTGGNAYHKTFVTNGNG
jgi:hypothetical protein